MLFQLFAFSFLAHVLWIFSITAVGVGACFATAVPSKECTYADKVIHQYVFVNRVKNLKRQHALKCDMDTRAELEEVHCYVFFVCL